MIGHTLAEMHGRGHFGEYAGKSLLTMPFEDAVRAISLENSLL